jgi:hypothetical protein
MAHLELKLKDRVNRIKKVIALGREFSRLNNFHGIMIVLGGLNRACVRRLKKTWDELSEEDLSNLKELEDLMNYRYCESYFEAYLIIARISCSGSFHAYRVAFEASKPPTIPYIGLFLTDLTFLDDGNPDFTEDGLINFQKHEVSLLNC